MGNLEEATELMHVEIYGIKPIKYMAEAITLETSNDEAGNKIHILAVEIEEKADMVIKVLRKFSDEYETPAQTVQE